MAIGSGSREPFHALPCLHNYSSKENMILRDYQEQISSKAAEIINAAGFCYLSMECRTGKTATALAAACKYGAKQVLFITKLKAIPSVQADFQAMQPTFSISVTNYESAHKYAGVEADLVILDEAHSIGAFPKPSKRQQVCRQICAWRAVLFLSGTPSPESYAQLYHQLQVCGGASPWAMYSNFYRWAKAGYIEPRQRMINGRLVNDYSVADSSRVLGDIAPYIIAYSQQQAGFEAQILEHDLQVKMDDYTETACKVIERDKLLYLPSGEAILADTPASLLNKLHQISGGTVIDDAGQRHIIDSSKAEAIAERFAGQKIAIFYCYQAEGDLLRAYFPNATDCPETFQATDSSVQFICQVRRAREGTRLDKADALIFYSTEYSYLSYEQGRQRLVSKERQQPANVYYLIGTAGIDSDILQAVRSKQDFTLAYYGRQRTKREMAKKKQVRNATMADI